MNMLQTKCFQKIKFSERLNFTPFDEVEVVIIGQDPYHNDFFRQMVCVFSVSDLVKAPPSLKNIFTELKDDLGIEKTVMNWILGRNKVFYCSMLL